MPSEMFRSVKSYEAPIVLTRKGSFYIRDLGTHRHEQHGTCRLSYPGFKKWTEVKLRGMSDSDNTKAILNVLYISPDESKDQEIEIISDLVTLECSEIANFIRKLMSS